MVKEKSISEQSDVLEKEVFGECCCDCVNCVTGNHVGCYYEPKCPANEIELLEKRIVLTGSGETLLPL